MRNPIVSPTVRRFDGKPYTHVTWIRTMVQAKKWCDWARKRGFYARYYPEFVGYSIWVRPRAGRNPLPKPHTTAKYIGPGWPKCDFCSKPASYDGKTAMGPWAYMCDTHFRMYGVGLGLGRGQKLLKNPFAEILTQGLGVGLGFGSAMMVGKKIMGASNPRKRLPFAEVECPSCGSFDIKSELYMGRIYHMCKKCGFEWDERPEPNPLTGVPLSRMSKSDLVYYHSHHHSWAKYAKTRTRYMEIKRSHDRVVREMKKRGVRHLSPL